MRTIVKCLLLLAALGAAIVHAQISQIQHVIVVIQENRTPDNLFQADSTLITNGADIASSGPCDTNPVPLTGQPLATCFDVHHFHHKGWETTWNHNQMNGACHTQIYWQTGCNQFSNPQYTYALNTVWDQQHNYKLLDPYFQLAGWYGYANYMFQTNMGPSFPAHQFLFSGTSAPTYSPQNYFDSFVAENPSNTYQTGCVAPAGQIVKEIPPNDPYNTEIAGYTPVEPFPTNAGFPCYEHPTMTDLLDNAKIKWHYYNYQNLAKSPYGAHIWNAPVAIQHICFPLTNNGQQCNGPHFNDGSIVTTGPEQILTDIQSCNLQPVSWVIPDGRWSDHPSRTDADAGPSWVAAIYNSVGGYDLQNNCGYWNNTVILVTWDDWGGFYDHVNPDLNGITGYSNGKGGQYVYGFRVPLLVISKYAKPGYISGACQSGSCQNYKQPYIHDFGSILRFTEKVFGLGQIDEKNNFDYADAQAPDAPPTCVTCSYSLSDFFDFTHQNAFQPILHPKYNATWFLHYYSNGNQPEDPDSDADETD
jgi:phospholipase C